MKKKYIKDIKEKEEVLETIECEKFEELCIADELKLRYAISNFGRLVSFKNTKKNIENVRVVNGSITEGYRIFRYKIRVDNKISYRHKFFHRMVAENFLKKTSDEQIYVLHLDHNLSNDIVSNLRWATKEEMIQHQRTNPTVIKARKKSRRRLIKLNKNRENGKLTVSQVVILKTLLANPERKKTLKTLAEEFGISEMQIYRIKTGKNWGHVKIDEQDNTHTSGIENTENAKNIETK